MGAAASIDAFSFKNLPHICNMRTIFNEKYVYECIQYEPPINLCGAAHQNRFKYAFYSLRPILSSMISVRYSTTKKS